MAASSPYIWPDTVSQSEHMDPAKKNLIKKSNGFEVFFSFLVCGLKDVKDQRACKLGRCLAIKEKWTSNEFRRS